ncbi:MAG: thymidine phosphorylase [Peptococcaceae bacterium]|nr:thymidine phosphorylase [Peptococcaceae bacterium]
MSELIERKRNGNKLSASEIRWIIQEYVAGTIPDCQMAAWAMAVFFQGMNAEETMELTMAMAQSGDILEWSLKDKLVVDKHSTGGVGDKTTLVVVPLVASCGVPVAKMSGRGLGHTGGTLDKLLAIPGFNVELSSEDMRRQVGDIGLAIAAQSASLVPADKKLYGLRDVTACVDSIPLIASSVMSKKIAAGAQGIVLDVKYGSGAFMTTRDRAQQLAEIMLAIGEGLGRSTRALISPMEEPLGMAVGNSLEVMEAIEVLQGGGPKDLREICIELAANMLMVGGRTGNEREAQALAVQGLQGSNMPGASVQEGFPQKVITQEPTRSTPAWQMFQTLVAAQGGSLDAFWEEVQGQRRHGIEPVLFLSPAKGTLARLDARRIGQAAMLLGAGRDTQDSPVDVHAGIQLYKKCGDTTEKGEPLMALYLSSQEPTPQEKMGRVCEVLKDAIDFRIN